MKVIVIVRTRNEQHHIDEFCKSYWWADEIIVADGGSTDGTIALARTYRNVKMTFFHEVVDLKDGYKFNPEGKHINFLIRAATKDKADWIIFDDCDCYPNNLVKRDGRKLLESCKNNFVAITRLYLWGEDKHFPRLAQPKEHDFDIPKYVPSLWAWKADLGMVASEEQLIHCTFQINGIDQDFKTNVLNLMPPYCLLHKFANPELTERKLHMYRDSGLVSEMIHPLEFGGPLEDLPEWAHE
jgi:Glycosyl transferase family 2